MLSSWGKTERKTPLSPPSNSRARLGRHNRSFLRDIGLFSSEKKIAYRVMLPCGQGARRIINNPEKQRKWFIFCLVAVVSMDTTYA